jgi:hypothetical protein
MYDKYKLLFKNNNKILFSIFLYHLYNMESNIDDNTETQSLKKGKIFLGIGIFIGIILLIIGLVLFFKSSNNPDFISTDAKITKVELCEKVNQQSTNYNCELQIRYKVNDKFLIKTINTNDKKYNFGETLIIEYNKKDPNNILIKKNTESKTFSYVLFVSGPLICIISYAIYYFMNRS